ncbi:tfiiic transcription initiation factor complex subunits tfc3 [Diplodia corticola]|uniref:Tfiiic transcription initiation factor complex subunits tfc3 n=1 Tax=Diplodia corticola TaxID=236234 RepID=A0A1J9QNU8_9PEZI|nr:tfiiic transcription initiation factor complex subunits tfc3 [Diplodia corticola]OJD30582.1 tfiiic transcription initiation factor complex subunits tfc3 [Diplodia corticola]
MAKGFDDLIEFLLEEIALRGEQGASTSDFKDLIYKFYAEQDNDVRPGRGAASTQHADRRLQEKVWIWLTAHPDICLNGGQSEQIPSLTDFEALESQDRPNPATEPPKAGEENGEAASASAANDAALKLFVSEERMWMAMTGHGVDAKRIPRHEFIILSIIAAHGEKGVVQPEITRISGQDKRSVPKRTDNLAKHGYITKVHVLAKGTRTSLCTLKRYAKTQREKKAALPPIHARSTPDEIKAVIFQDGLLLYDKFFDILMDILQDCKIVTIEDCKRKLGITTKTWEMKSLWRSMRRLEGLGLVKKVKAQIKGYAASQKWYRCIKMVREPTQRDRMIFVTMSMKEAKKHKRETEAGVDEDAEGYLDPDEETEEAGASQALVQQESDVQEIKRLPPQWDPDRPVINLLWDIIRSTGHSGATTAIIRDQGLGTFYRRPIDAILGRISDIWHISQPPHLRHFAIIRDTGQSDKYLHYVYRTYGNFQLAVDVGEAAWEVVITQPVNMNPGKKPRAKVQKNVREAVHREYGEIDEWGFPQINESAFEGHSGMATLKDSNKALMTNLKPLPSRGYMPTFITGGYVRSQRNASVDSDEDFPPASSRKRSAPGVDKLKRKYTWRSPNGPGPGRRKKSQLAHEASLTPNQTENVDNGTSVAEAPGPVPDTLDGSLENLGGGEHPDATPAKRAYRRKKLPKLADTPQEEIEERQPGVYLNPIWGKKPRDPTVKGRPKKAKVVVVVLDALKGLGVTTPEFIVKVADAKLRSDARLQEAKDQAATLQKETLPDSLRGVFQPTNGSVPEQTPIASTTPMPTQGPQETPGASNAAEPPIFHMLDEMPSSQSFSTPTGPLNAASQMRQMSLEASSTKLAPSTPITSDETPATILKKRGRARKDPNAPPKPRKMAKKKAGDIATSSAANGASTQQPLSPYLTAPSVVAAIPPRGDDIGSASAVAADLSIPSKQSQQPKNQTLSGQLATQGRGSDDAVDHDGSQPGDTESSSKAPTTFNPFVAMAAEYQKSYPALYAPTPQPFNPFIAAAQEHNRSVTSTPVPSFQSPAGNSTTGITPSNRPMLATAQRTDLNMPTSSHGDQVRPNSSSSDRSFAAMRSNSFGQLPALNGHRRPNLTTSDSGMARSPTGGASTYLGNSRPTTSANGAVRNGNRPNLLPALAPAATSSASQQGLSRHSGLYDQLRSASLSGTSYQNHFSQAFHHLPSGAPGAAVRSNNGRGPIWGTFTPSKQQLSSRTPDTASILAAKPSASPIRQDAYHVSSPTPPVRSPGLIVSSQYSAKRADERPIEIPDETGSETEEDQGLLRRVSSASKRHDAISEMREAAQTSPGRINQNVADNIEQSSVADHTAEDAAARMPAAPEDDTMQDAMPMQDEDHDDSHLPPETSSTPKQEPRSGVLLTESPSATGSTAHPTHPSSADQPPSADMPSIAAQDEQMPPLEEEPPASVPAKRQKGKWAGGKKQGVKLSGGGILNFNRTKLLVSIIEKCGGVFPGDFEIHRPFVGTWNKEYGAERQVDRDTIKRTIKNAIDSGKVRRFAYSFKNKNGVMTSRHILTLPSIAQSDPLVTETQKRVIAAWPRVYTPPQMQEYEEEIGNSWYGDKYKKDTSVRVERSNLPPWMRDMELRTAENQRKREEERTRRLEREARGLPRLTRPGRGRGGRGRGGVPRPVLTGRTGRKRLAGLPRPAADPDDDPWNPFQPRYLRPYDSDDEERLFAPTAPTRTRSISELSGTFQVDNFIFHRPTHDSALASDSEDSSMFGTPFSSRSGTPVPFTPSRKRRRRSSVNSLGSTDTTETPGRVPTFQVDLSQSRGRRGSVASVDSSRAASVSSFRLNKPRPLEWSFRHAGPDTYDPTWHIQDITTLTDPDILFYHNTGTFSTEYHVVRDARLALWVQPHAQHQQEFEDSLPWSLKEMKDSVKMKGKERDHNRRGNANLSRFERELIVVSHWEDQYLRKNEDLGLAVRQPHFINHNFYGDQEEPENEWTVTGLKWDDMYSQTFTPYDPPSFDETDESDAPDWVVVEGGKRRRRTGGAGTRGTKRRRRTAVLDALDDGVAEPRRRQKGPRPSKSHLARAPTQDPLCVISTSDTKKLLYAMVVVQSLLGGIEGYTSWDQIRRLFRTHERWDLTSFRNRWVWLKTRCAEVVESLFDEFQQAYLLAYECGDVQPINYDNVDDYDWDGIVKWTMQNISIKPHRMADPHSDLPTSRKELDAAFLVHETNEWNGPPKESLYNEGCLSTRRKELTQQYSFYLPLTARPKPKEKSTSSQLEQKTLERAKTWVRSVIVTPEERFDTETFGTKLKAFEDKILTKVTSELVSTKYFRDEQKGRTKPGRNYGVDRTFPKAFERQLLPTQLIDAMRFKKDLDDAFSGGAPSYTVSNAAKDGHVLAIINLAQSGHLQINPLLPAVDHAIGKPFPRLTKWGFTEGHYKTVQMPRDRVTWPLEIVPTDKYVCGNPLLKERGLEALPPPPLPADGGEREGFVPLWADLFGETIWEWWHRVLTAVVHVVFGRPGIGVEGVRKALKDAVDEWEIELCIGWLVQVGALEEMRLGVVDGERPRGWRLGEWWWCVLAE